MGISDRLAAWCCGLLVIVMGTGASAQDASLPPPRSPDETLAITHVPAGFRLELAACEPEIADPVAIDWGPDGRLWVVEMGDYPLGAGEPGRPGGRVRVLRDRDGDGRYESSTLFLEGLAYPNGVMAWRDGVLLTVAPQVLYAVDRDGDDRADEVRMLYEGFVPGNQQHRCNGLVWGLDGWVHLCNGDSGGQVRSLITGAEVEIRGRDLRIRPDTGELDATTGQTQFGKCRDDFDNWFGGNNSNPLWHYALRDDDLRRAPHVAPPALRRPVLRESGAAPVFPRSTTLERFNDYDKANRFTSACSPWIYRDELLGPEFRDNLLVCEPVHNLVHRESLRRQGSSFYGERPESERSSEFFASEDNWCRPVMVRTGPDGAIWIVDMYRLVIEHPEWIPRSWQERLDLRAGHDRGRIYRIVPTDRPARTLAPLAGLDVKQLADALDDPSPWRRDLAQRMLLQQENAQAAIPRLSELVANSSRDATVAQAIWTLAGLKALTPELLSDAAGHANPGVRQTVARLTGAALRGERVLAQPLADLARDSLESTVLRLVNDRDGLVRLEATLGLRGVRVERSARLAGSLTSDDEYLATAALMAITEENAAAVLSAIAALPQEQQGTRLDALLRLVQRLGKSDGIDTVVGGLAARVAQEFDEAGARRLAAAVAAVRGAGGQLAGADTRDRLRQVAHRAAELVDDAERPLELRVAAIGLLGVSNVDGAAAPDWMSWLAPRQPPEIQLAALEALARRGGPGLAPLVLEGWAQHSPTMRSRVLDVLLASQGGAERLLEELAEGRISTSQIDARRRQLLLAHDARSPRATAGKQVLEAGTAAGAEARRAIVDSHRDALQLSRDAARGRDVFAKRCATCHRLESRGAEVGPDLTSLTDNSADSLLVAILDPNRALEDKFTDYVAITESGERITGVLESESATGIVLLAPEGKRRTILREELERLASTGRSAMPEGLERDLSRQDLADVIEYVRSAGPPPKAFAGNEPRAMRPESDGSLYLTAATCRIYGPRLEFESQHGNLGWWMTETDRAVWDIEVAQSGVYDVQIEYACDPASSGNHFQLRIGGQVLRGQVKATASWEEYRRSSAGTMELTSGPAELVLRSDGPLRSALFDVRHVRLVPRAK